MKLLAIGDEARTRKFLPDLPVVNEVELACMPRGASDEELLAVAADADFIMVDAISPVSAELMAQMPKLKLVHSEGVAFNAIDCAAAREQGVIVCNNRGANAVAVAEQTLLLMLGLLKNVRAGDAAVRTGQQIGVKEALMVSGIDELDGSSIGLLGFGDIAREVAKRLNVFGATVYYNKRSPLSYEEEEKLGAHYLPLDELLGSCDFVSFHLPVTPATTGMANDEFFEKMKDGSYLVNTARGEVVDNEACVRALVSGKLAGAAFDTLAPEPVTCDNPLLNLPEGMRDRVLFSPHIGGVTTNMFRRAHRTVWGNVQRVIDGEKPVNVVNG